MRVSRRPSWLVGLRLLAALAIGGGAYAVYLMACSSNGPNLSIMPATLPNPIANAAYSQQLTVSGGTNSANYSWSVASGGSLPPNISLDKSSGLLSGTPTAAGGPYAFTVQVTDQFSDQGSQQYTVSVVAALAITTTSPLPGGTVGSTYQTTGLQFAASGGTSPYTWAITSATTTIPPGLSMSSSGLLSGTPTGAGGSFTFTVKVTDANSNIASLPFTVMIAPPVTLAITTTSPLPGGAVNVVYNTSGLQFAASGGVTPYTWQITTAPATVPPGLSLSTSGLLSGTPTAAGTYTFTVQATDANTPTPQMVPKSFTVTIALPPPTLTITTTSPLPGGTVGVVYNTSGLQFAAAGGTSPYTWAITSAPATVPPGLALSASGLLSGTPTGTGGSYTFTVQVTDAASHMTSGPFSVTIALAPVTITTTSPLPAGTVGSAYTTPLVATGGTGTYVWSVTAGATPTGLTLNADGTWSGTPTVANTFTFTAKATSGTATPASKAFSLTINPASTGLAITTDSPLPDAADTSYYGITFTAFNGAAPYTWAPQAVGVLPPGLSLSSSGFLSGIPTNIGSTTFGVTVTDHNGAAVTKSFTLAVGVVPSTCMIIPVTMASATYASTALYKVTLRASDACIANQPGYNVWNVTLGTLPTGFNFNTGSTADTASITANGIGAPPGTYNISITFHGQDTENPPTGANVTQVIPLVVH